MSKPAIPFKVTDHYSNILLLAPDNEPLATIPVKRARWYKKRDLVEVVEKREGFNEVLRLLVEPAGRPEKDIVAMENRCVVCGTKEQLSCHHVIPKAIRTHFPPEYKNHSHQWCLLLCEEHHLAAEKKARVLYEKPMQEATAKAYRVHAEFIQAYASDWFKNGYKPDPTDMARLREARKVSVRLAQMTCANQLILDYGGYEATIQKFKGAFLELNPQFVPSGFLT